MNAWRRFRIRVFNACFSEDEVLAFALDGLEGPARRVAKAHLDHCEHCRQALREVMELQDAMGLSSPGVPVPADLAGRVLAKLSR
jgi:predicted anti-sigma-YlaC factor YlaD